MVPCVPVCCPVPRCATLCPGVLPWPCLRGTFSPYLGIFPIFSISPLTPCPHLVVVGATPTPSQPPAPQSLEHSVRAHFLWSPASRGRVFFLWFLWWWVPHKSLQKSGALCLGSFPVVQQCHTKPSHQPLLPSQLNAFWYDLTTPSPKKIEQQSAKMVIHSYFSYILNAFEYH